MLRVLLFTTLFSLTTVFSSAVLAELQPEGLKDLSDEELQQFNFTIDHSDRVITDLTVGQRYVLSQQRREMKDMIARHLGIIRFENNRGALRLLQQMVDREVILDSEVRDWQSLGIIFGDILANEFGLTWVSYEDDLGISKVLRWRNTDNFVFPVTMFSKRVQYGDPVNVQAIFDDLELKIREFKAIENEKVEFRS